MNPNHPNRQNAVPRRTQLSSINSGRDSQNGSLVPLNTSYYPQFPFPSQRPHQRLWQWLLWPGNRRKLAIGGGILAGLLVLGGIFIAITNAASNLVGSQQQPQTVIAQTTPQPQTVVVQATPRTIFQAPVSISIPTVMPTPNTIPTPKPSPALAPKPIQKANVTVSSQMVKKVGGKYRYLFDISNNDSKSFKGSAIISLYNNKQQTPLGQDTFDMTQPLQPDSGSVVYFDVDTGPVSQQGTYGITHFKYTIIVDEQQANAGEEQITDNYEDTSLF